MRGSWLLLVCLAGCGEQAELFPDEADTDGETGGGSGPAPVVQPECHPLDLTAECPSGDGCYPGAGATAFACAPGGPGGFGASCSVSTECQRGALCIATQVVPGCSDGWGCCTWFCEIGDGGCPSGTWCAPYFNGDAPVGFESLGACVPKGA